MVKSDDPFYRYYADESLKETTLERFEATKAAVRRAARHFGLRDSSWSVADVGCGAGTQCLMWARDGHQVFGADINEALIALGRERAAATGVRLDLTVASATQLPWPDASMDVCLCPELLEHVADWQSCLDEALRVMKPGGVLYLSTTNKLCPVQEEFTLPGYSWYPAPLKRRYERLAVTTRPELVNHAKYPAVNWFTFYGLRSYLAERGVRCLDRFDVTALQTRGLAATAALRAICTIPLVRWTAHVLTPYTMVFAQKSAA